MKKEFLEEIKKDLRHNVGGRYLSFLCLGDKRRYHAVVASKVYRDKKSVYVDTYWGNHILSSSELYFTEDYEQLKELAEEIEKNLPSFEELEEKEKRGNTLPLTFLFA